LSDDFAKKVWGSFSLKGERMYYIITSSKGDYLSKFVKQLQNKANICLITDRQLIEKNIKIGKHDKFYIPSDMVYGVIRDHFDPCWQGIIEKCRDKYLFRQNLRNLYPDFIFNKTTLDEIDKCSFDFTKRKRYIIKPTIGFMAGGARIISKSSNLDKVKEEIRCELDNFARLYPDIFSSDILIEECIEGGEEFAVDMYYDNDGLPKIVNIYGHPFSARPEYLQLLYYASKELFNKYYDSFYKFFDDFNSDRSITSFPIHAEFMLNESGEFVPIEFNAGRFGGMGVADLTYYAFKIQPILSYFQGKFPDRVSIWKGQEQDLFCWVLAYNAADYSLDEYRPNHALFKKMLPENAMLLEYVELDYKKMPAFAIAYLKLKNAVDIKKILSIEFNDCFEKKDN
jgi:hypothetical protein